MKTVIITGANGNLGQSAIAFFLQKEYRVLAAVHKMKSAEEFPQHDNLSISETNLSDEAVAAAFVNSAIAKYQSIEAALLLVGGFSMGDVAATATADIRSMIALNFETAYHLARPLFQHMMETGYGRLIFVGARPALDTHAGKKMMAYALSKAMVIHLAQLLNAEAKGKNVTATVIVPSTIDTEANRKSMPNANFDDWVKPEKIAAIMEMVSSSIAEPLRETVLKVYGNS